MADDRTTRLGGADSDKTQIDPNSPMHRKPAPKFDDTPEKTQIDLNSPLHRKPGAPAAAEAAAQPAPQAAPQPTTQAQASGLAAAGASAMATAAASARAAAAQSRASSDEKTVASPTMAMRARAAASAPGTPFNPPPQDPSIALPIGYRLHEYRVDSILGQGGFGITYMATDVNLNSKVAIKEYLPEQFAYRATTKSVSARSVDDLDFYNQGLESFLVEARTLATFRHPNIVRVARFFEANNSAYMVLEYEKGTSLRAWWKTNNTIDERDLLALLLPLMDGLGAVHRAGYLHRDIKPDNINVRSSDGSLVLLDFGAARQAAASDPEAANIVTPGYGPLEQYYGDKQGPWTDVYALGATLYWMVSGQKPPEATDRVVKDTMEPAVVEGKGRYSEQFLKAIDWALAVKAEDRPQDVRQFAEALFAAHAATLGLKEALAADGGQEEDKDTFLDVVKSPRKLRQQVNRIGQLIFRPWSWPIALKMVVAMMGTALAPMLITAWYNTNGSTESMSRTELRNLQQLSQSVSGRIAQLMDDTTKLANFLARDRDFVGYLEKPGDALADAIRAKLADLLKANPDLQLVMVFDTEGTARVSSDPQVQGRNFKFREYFKVAMEGKPFTTGIVVGAVAGANGVFFSYPVTGGPDGKVIGAVVLRLLAKPIETMLEEARSAERTAFMIDEDGVIVYHPEPKLRFASLAPLPKPVLDEIVADQRFRRDKIEALNMPELARTLVKAKTSGTVSFESRVSNKDEIAGYAPVPGRDWVVVVTETREAFSAPLDALFANVLYSVFLVGAVFLLLAMLFARSIVRPIEQLTAAANALKRGDYDAATMKVTSSDEVGQLARTFNVLIDVLRQRERERERVALGQGTNAGRGE